jgi:hypothetical protein
LAAAAVMVAANNVAAQTLLDVNLNDFTVVSSPTSDGFTFDFAADGDTAINEIFLDGTPVPGFVNPFPSASAGLGGSFSLVGDDASGTIDAGNLTLTDADGNTLAFSNASGTYSDTGSGLGVTLFLSGDGLLTGSSFAGVDLSGFEAASTGNAVGFFFDSSLLSPVGDVDDEASIDLSFELTVIPEPTAGLALAGTALLALRRRR